MGRRNSRTSVPAGGQTMELDAVVDQLEEIAPPPGGLAAAPPPLPPKKSSPMMYVVAVIVVAVMAGLGIAAGSMLLGDPDSPPVTAPPEPVAEADSTEPEEPEAPPSRDEAAEGEGPGVVQLEEVVFDE